MTLRSHTQARLRRMGYATADAKAIIGIAKAAPSCRPARRWWNRDVSTLEGEGLALEMLWQNVSKLAARYSVAFLASGVSSSNE